MVADEGIEARFHRGGTAGPAATPAQLLRARASRGVRALMGLRRGGLPSAERRRGARACASPAALGGLYTPHCAAVDPARLVRGLAEVVGGAGRRDLRAHARARASPSVVHTRRRHGRAPVIVRATEGFTAGIARPAPPAGARSTR